MSENVNPMVKRSYRRIPPDYLAYAKSRFEAMASTSAVKAELMAKFGADIPHSALHYYWTKANKRTEARAAVSDRDTGDEQP
jgi:hypothetical protein